MGNYLHRTPIALRVLAAMSAGIVLLVGCSSGKETDMQPTMDVRQAEYRIKTHIEETLEQLPDTARLTNPFKTNSLPCRWEDDGTNDKVFVEHSYTIDGLSVDEHLDEYFDTVQKYWESRGYRKTRYDQSGSFRSMVYTDPDGFRLRLFTDFEGKHLNIRSQSPCIWPNGLPPTDD